MQLGELVQSVWNKLGGSVEFYTTEEVILNGINPAQRLMCLLRPDLLVQRTAVSVLADQVLIDLRQHTPRLWGLQRVMLGNVTGDTPVLSNGQLRELTSISRKMLAYKRNWWTHRGLLRHYWRHGRFFIGLYRRSLQNETLTVIYNAMPTAFELRDMGRSLSPDIQAAWHPVIAEVATGLLLIKEGTTEAEKGMARLSEALGNEPFSVAMKDLDRIQRQSAMNQGQSRGTTD